jgi:hypothetical protein
MTVEALVVFYSVTEVVWEGEDTAGDKAEKNVGNSDAGSR